ncbi:MAG: hypothetical protein P4L22_05630 [Candidatus Babeliales bacterium]|nr:hypothetical protein [Candidatus Babeliales bacterium]
MKIQSILLCMNFILVFDLYPAESIAKPQVIEDIDYNLVQVLEYKIKNRFSGNNDILDQLHHLLSNYDTWISEIKTNKDKLNAMQEQSSELVNDSIDRLSKLEDFLNNLYSRSPWSRGREVMKKLQSSSSSSSSSNKLATHDNLRDIVNLVWYFYALAVKKGQGFEQGAFAIVPNQEVIFNFLSGYKETYDRTGQSSHFKEEDAFQFGIDIEPKFRKDKEIKISLSDFLDSKEATDLMILPKNMFHILFGNMKRIGYLYVKPENFGTKNEADFATHADSHAASLISRGGNQENMRKEHVPNDIVKLWKELIGQYDIQDNQSIINWKKAAGQDASHFGSIDLRSLNEKCIEKGAKYGIYEMIDILNMREFSENKESKQKFLELINKRFDHLKYRKGNEVILTDQELF